MRNSSTSCYSSLSSDLRNIIYLWEASNDGDVCYEIFFCIMFFAETSNEANVCFEFTLYMVLFRGLIELLYNDDSKSSITCEVSYFLSWYVPILLFLSFVYWFKFLYMSATPSFSSSLYSSILIIDELLQYSILSFGSFGSSIIDYADAIASIHLTLKEKFLPSLFSN